MKKRLVSLAVAAMCLFTAPCALAEYSFSDISGSQYDWCAPQIEQMNQAGYINGYEDGTYRPDNEVTKLECIALFARAMGSNDANNADLLDIAHEQYDSALKGSSLAWGEDELAFMMYKGAFTAADLITYINGDAKNLPMSRGEAAVIITKAMLGEAKATDEAGISLHYTDARDIPSNLLQYVKFVTDEGIMNGIDDAFCASNTVTRSQIAVMLSRVLDKCDYTFEKGKFVSADEDAATAICVIDGNEEEFDLADDAKFFMRGEAMSAVAIPENVSAVIQFSGDKIVSVDALSDVADEEITAIFAGYNATSTTMNIRVKANENSQNTKIYTCDVNVPITYQGSPATIKALKSGDSIVLTLTGGKVTSITAVEKLTEIAAAEITDIEIENDASYITIASSVSAYDGKTYPVSDNVTVIKNNKDADMTSVYVGDKVNLTVKYGEIIRIVATGVSNTIEGVITNINIGNTPEITLTVGGKSQVYTVPVNCEIEKNGEVGDIYDLRLNDNIKLTVQSGAVIKIKSIASITNTSGKVSGVVTAVNGSYKFISVLTADSSEPVNVHVNTKTRYVLAKGASSSAQLDNITSGDTVECYVTPSNGAYVADLIVISKAN